MERRLIHRLLLPLSMRNGAALLVQFVRNTVVLEQQEQCVEQTAATKKGCLTELAVGSWGSSTSEEYVAPDSDASCDVLYLVNAMTLCFTSSEMIISEFSAKRTWCQYPM